MTLSRAAMLATLLMGFERTGAQGVVGNDSLSALSPAQRYAQICPGPRDAGTGAIIGRVRDLDDSTSLASATVSTQWIDLKDTKGHLSNASAKTNNSGFYLLCGVPALVRLNLRTERGGYVGTPAQAALDDRLIGSVDIALRRMDRGASDTSAPTSRGAQRLAAVAIDEKAVLPSWMERSGFEQRRKMGLGAFITEAEIARHGFSNLIEVLGGARGVRVEWNSDKRSSSGFSTPMPYLLGVTSPGSSVYCRPNFFLDGAPFAVRNSGDYRDLSALLPPVFIKGVEVYSGAGTIPAQYDLTSSTGCGSIVIWTR
jgi:TonB-dependent Receptor Plug Domain